MTVEAGSGQYIRRTVDDELDELVGGLPAISIEGPKAVGKTVTALRRARTVHRLDRDAERSIAEAEPDRLVVGEPPILIDEWQRLPESWDRVRRAVDDGAEAGSFLLTGSASPTKPPTHSGAGRIVTVRMRPLSLAERRGDSSTVSLRDLLSGAPQAIDGAVDVGLEYYVDEILRSGFPGIRRYSGRLFRSQLDGYLQRIVDRDFPELGRQVRRPMTLRRWMAAYAAATATTASFEKIREAAASDRGEAPSKTTTQPYRDTLEALWIIDSLPAWLPTKNQLKRLAASPKHHLADPALAARLLHADASTLLGGQSAPSASAPDGPLLGKLFESLVTLSVRVYAQSAEAHVGHLRAWAGEREVDLIVQRGEDIVAVEVKLGQTVNNDDVRHLLWLRDELGDAVRDLVVVTTGRVAYRRPDGVAVIPAALLGP